MICKPPLKAFLKQMLFLVISFNSFSLTVIAQKPNIILILADDVGYSSLTVNGGQSYSMPCLDSMARHGMNFTHCEATPLCSTSRSTFLTGKYNVRNFSNFNYLNTDSKTVANLLKSAGYVTGIFGKHQAQYGMDTMKNWGWDYHCIFELTENSMKYSRYKNPVFMENGVVLSGSQMQNKYGDDVLTDKICTFIENNLNRPFFVYYPMSIGHPPLCPTPDDPEFATWNPDKGVSDTSFYASMMHYMDKKVGVILNKLKTLGIENNTLVIFSGDNGTPVDVYYYTNGQKLRGEKAWPLEGGTHVPLIAYWPTHIAEGSVNNDLVDFTDFFTTFAKTAGIQNLNAYGKLDGISFYDAMLGNPHAARQQSYVLYNNRPGINASRRWAQTQVYKLYDSNDIFKAKKFYNFSKDPEEKQAIANNKLTPAEKIIRASLQAMLDTMPVWPVGPVVNNASVKNITATSALVTATIVSSGATALKERGSNMATESMQGAYLGISTLRDLVVNTGTFSMQRNNLNSQMHYTYSLYGMNKNSANSTGYAIDSFYTLSLPPVTQPANFNGTAQSSASVNLTWSNAKYPPVTGAKKAGYLVVYSTGAIKLADQPNGKPPATAVVNGTIASTASTALPKLPATSVKVNGLTPSVKYNFLLVPYTWNGTVTDTYNYLTQNARSLTITMPATFALDKQPAIKVADAGDITVTAAK